MIDGEPAATASGNAVASCMQMSSAPREVEVQAAADFKMITEEEAAVRKGAGVAIGVATAALFAGGALGYGPLSAGAFGAISTYRTGREYLFGVY